MNEQMNQKIEGKGEVTMSLYEINQSLISQLPPYDEEKVDDLIERINHWDLDKNCRVTYYMMLNNDKHYYTIFKYEDKATHTDFNTLGKGVVVLLKEMGYTIMSDEIYDDHCEIWVKDDIETVAYLLFPYDQGVVTYG